MQQSTAQCEHRDMANRGKAIDGYATVSAKWFLSKRAGRGKDRAELVN